ncbi:TraK protein [Moritella viscosa]|uniref:TraK protein n=2 Tax=Moritella viscosa TaxID=80854 RepID=A0A1L0AN78_9GAMM|nr:TraK protein [Moritella viscosa]SGZ07410.1 TraK protein [Moritella viscosa]SGZ15716.1 TraK protein [Moritella viscosa]SGZ19336.1 TraK protein [Moritella viscosa]SHO28541.1 TraK protein [Moritella viscosa]
MKSSGLNLSLFLAQKKEIQMAYDNGYSIKAIWETLQAEGAITYSYSTFARYVNRHLNTRLKEDKGVESSITTKTQSKQKMVNSSRTPKNTPPTKPKNKFNWSPNYDAKALTG